MTDTPDEPAICSHARVLAGLTEEDDAYRAIVDPAGSSAEEASVAHGVSSCMLVAAWLLGWRGRFVGDTIQTTLRGLWGGGTGRTPKDDGLCYVGAQLWWAKSASAEEHVDACVLEISGNNVRVDLTAIAGGQRVTAEDVAAGTFDAAKLGKRCIKLVSRTVEWRGSAWVDVATGRHVLGVHDDAG